MEREKRDLTESLEREKNSIAEERKSLEEKLHFLHFTQEQLNSQVRRIGHTLFLSQITSINQTNHVRVRLLRTYVEVRYVDDTYVTYTYVTYVIMYD